MADAERAAARRHGGGLRWRLMVALCVYAMVTSEADGKAVVIAIADMKQSWGLRASSAQEVG